MRLAQGRRLQHMHKSKRIPFNDPFLSEVDCYYEVDTNGQVFRSIYRGGELTAQEPTGESAAEAAFAAQYFTGLKDYKLNKDDDREDISNLPMAQAIMEAAQSFFIELEKGAGLTDSEYEAIIAAINEDTSSTVAVAEPVKTETAVPQKKTFMQRVRYFMKKLIGKA